MSLVRTLAVLLLAASTASAAGEAATADMQILRDTIRANKKALVAASLTLSDAEAGQFWPLFDRYQAEMTAVNDRLVKLIEEYTANYRTLSDEKALDLANQHLAIEEDRIKVKKTYLPQFAKVLPGKKVARLYQIENKVEVILKHDLAEEIPVVEEAPQ
jgi:hypothetical protein